LGKSGPFWQQPDPTNEKANPFTDPTSGIQDPVSGQTLSYQHPPEFLGKKYFKIVR
jgi:hypothetical protein